MAELKPVMLRAIGVDHRQVEAFWHALVRHGQVHEVRILNTKRSGPNRLFGTVSGYFDNAEALITAIERFTGYDAGGVYITLNPVNPDLLARANNRLNRDGAIEATKDEDVLERRHVFIDVDPKRPSGVSATDNERALALERRDLVAAYLADLGWPQPVATMETGNGGGLIYRVALDNTPESAALVSRVLHGIKALYEDETVSIDTSVSNAARIVKLAGTVAAKGDETDTRPWRLATATATISALPVPSDLLERVAIHGDAAYPARPTAKPTAFPGSRPLADELPDILARNGIAYRTRQTSYGLAYDIDRCLTSSDHTDGAYFIAFPSGAVDYGCSHNRCQGKGWADVREQLGIESARHVTVTVGAKVAPGTVEHSFGKLDRTDQEIADEWPPVPEIAFAGVFGRYRDLMAPTTSAPDTFHLGALLTFIGAHIGRQVSLYLGSRIYANLFTIIVGPTGTSKKDTAIKRPLEMASRPQGLTVIRPPFEIIRSLDSSQGLVTVLKESPNVLVYLSEFTKLIKHNERKATSTLIDELLVAWDSPETMEVNTRKDPLIANRPYVSMISAIQPGRLATYIKDEDIYSGFVNRCLFFFAQGKPLIPLPPKPDYKAAWDIYRDIYYAINHYPEGSELTLSEAAAALWDPWYRELNDPRQSEDERDVRARHDTLAQKIALIYAVMDESPVIDAQHITIAMAIVDWMWGIVRETMKGWAIGIESQIELRITKVLGKRGPLSRRDLTVQCINSRKWSSGDIAKVVRAMLENNVLGITDDNMVALL